jgi:hypothetical protein
MNLGCYILTKKLFSGCLLELNYFLEDELLSNMTKK